MVRMIWPKRAPCSSSSSCLSHTTNLQPSDRPKELAPKKLAAVFRKLKLVAAAVLGKRTRKYYCSLVNAMPRRMQSQAERGKPAKPHKPSKPPKPREASKAGVRQEPSSPTRARERKKEKEMNRKE